jgi:hypothetical protein
MPAHKPPMLSLPAAMKAFVKGGYDRTKMLVPAWADTFRPASPDDIRTCWEREMTEHSQQQHNNYETPEGK